MQLAHQPTVSGVQWELGTPNMVPMRPSLLRLCSAGFFHLKVALKAPLSLIGFLCGLRSQMAGVETLVAPLRGCVALGNTLSLTGLLSLDLA